jgi:hypothetical protein
MRDRLDIALDDALKSYAAVEPSPGLAVRILRQARQGSAPRRSNWRWTLAFALPSVAALALAFVFAGRVSLPAPPPAIASLPSPPGADAGVTTREQLQIPGTVLTAVRREPIREHKARTARSAARPLPAPYSKEELTMLAFVQQHPKEAAEIVEAQKRDAGPLPQEPIRIAPLEAKPLTIAALHQEN